MKPIIFSSEMVRAVLEGRKTQTRRVVKPQPIEVRHALWQWEHNRRTLCRDSDTLTFSLIEHSPYQTGGLLWVRETFAEIVHGKKVTYRADCNDYERSVIQWTPSIFMPRWASRITLRVVDVRAERVQDISWNDALAEGVGVGGLQKKLGTNLTHAQDIFVALWDSVVKRAFSWKINPWVWVIEFKVEEANVGD